MKPKSPKMVTTGAFAAKHGMLRQRVQELLRQKRIPGAVLLGKSKAFRGVWTMPLDAEILPHHTKRK